MDEFKKINNPVESSNTKDYFEQNNYSISWQDAGSNNPFIKLYTKDKEDVGIVNFHKIDDTSLELTFININEKYTNSGVGFESYKWFLNNLPSGITFVYADKHNQYNKVEIPQIYSKLKQEGYIFEENETNYILKNK